MAKSKKPSLAWEKRLFAEGYQLVAGVDEVGRGALAGPVMAAAVILPRNLKARWLREVRDSKLIDGTKREYLFPFIKEAAVSYAVGVISCSVVDSRGIAKATRLAMKSAIDQLTPPPDFVLIDYFHVPEIEISHDGVPDGDSLCMSIACASIIAKVTRDRLMVELDGQYPGYGLAEHKGYGTESHVECIHRLGPSPIHRRTFRPVMERLL